MVPAGTRQCPECGSESIEALDAGDLLPPRRSQRSHGEELAARAQPVLNRTNRELRGAADLGEIKWVGRDGWGAFFPLIASTLIPGTGHLLVGRVFLGLLAMAVTGLLAFLISRSLFSPWFLYLTCFSASWLVVVHLHCYFLALNTRPDVTPPVSGIVLMGFLMSIIIGQLYWFQNYIYDGKHEYQLMYSFHNVFLRNDRILIRPQIAREDWRQGDIARVNEDLIERVYALPGDHMKFENGFLSVNGQRIMGEQFLPVTVGNKMIRVFPPGTETVDLSGFFNEAATVPANHLGFMVQGKIHMHSMETILGRIEAINFPPDRKKSLLGR